MKTALIILGILFGLYSVFLLWALLTSSDAAKVVYKIFDLKDPSN